MKLRKFERRFLSLCLALALLLPLVPAQTFATEVDEIEKVYCNATIEEPFSDNEVLLVMMPEYNENVYVVSDFSDIGCIALEELSCDIEPGTLSRIILLTLDQHSKQNVLDSIALLEQRADIYSAEPNWIAEMQIEPSDPMYTSQWAADVIDLPAAWDICTEAYSVYVGVIDSGINDTHYDLFNVNASMSRNYTGDGTSAVSDSIGHGTMVASVIGADGDNNIGMSGVCWGVNLVSLKVVYRANIDDDSDLEDVCDASAVISAIEYADSVGIDILNISLAISGSNSTSFRTALASYDGLVVCAAGNNGWELEEYSIEEDTYEAYQVYPAMHNSLSNVISVGASTSADRKAYFSNYGNPWVDIFAPGEDIQVCTTSGGYSTASGTSFAAPYVAGVAALVLQKNPNMTASQLKTRICDTGDYILALSPYCRTGKRLNAYNALIG